LAPFWQQACRSLFFSTSVRRNEDEGRLGVRTLMDFASGKLTCNIINKGIREIPGYLFSALINY